MPIGWQAAMSTALYGDEGFFVAGAGPAAHFRTSAHAVPVLGDALLRLLGRLDAALGHPDRLDVVDVGAGRGELLSTLVRLAPPELAARLRPTAVELAPRPDSLAATIRWRHDLPDRIVGLLLGTEWLDNVPLDVATPGPAGWRRVLVDPATGAESVGGPLGADEADWLARWWPTPPDSPPPPTSSDQPNPPTSPPAPLTSTSAPAPASPGQPIPTDQSIPPGQSIPADRSGRSDGRDPWDRPGAGRAEIGLTRDTAWAGAVAAVRQGLALAVDYGHLRDRRPPDGTLTGFRAGRQVVPVPDGGCDLTAHVAMDSVAATGSALAGLPYTLVSQVTALRALGTDGRRPPLTLASTDPAGYVRALARASTAAELTDPAGLGGHWWLFQPVGVRPAEVLPPGVYGRNPW